MKWFVGIMVVVTSIFIFVINKEKSIKISEIASPTDSLKQITPTEKIETKWEVPINEFKKRISKKFFGTMVTPKNSPVLPERFSGYHTGVDVEYTDIANDVSVVAVGDGVVEESEYALGYGGVVVVKHDDLYAIYGHLRPASMVKKGVKVIKGQQIGVLGTGYSKDTDGERRHLHFGVAKINTIKGYVLTKKELGNWIDPLSLY